MHLFLCPSGSQHRYAHPHIITEHSGRLPHPIARRCTTAASTPRRATSPPPRLPASWGANYVQVGGAGMAPGLALQPDVALSQITANYGSFQALGSGLGGQKVCPLLHH